MKQLFTPVDYEKLTDDIFYFGNKMMLRMNVSLAKKNDDGTRRYFHKDFLYGTDKYSDKKKVITMRRSFDFYLTIDKLDMYEQSVMIRVQNMILLKMRLKEISKWFSDGNTFVIRKNKLIIQSRPSPIIIDNLPGHKSIMFEPVVKEWEDNNEQQPGVRITLNNSEAFCDISIDNFYGFYYLIDTINLYQSAQLLINYSGRPDIGNNMMEFERGDYSILEEPVEPESIKAKDGRTPKNIKNKSFFDKIDEIGG